MKYIRRKEPGRAAVSRITGCLFLGGLLAVSGVAFAAKSDKAVPFDNFTANDSVGFKVFDVSVYPEAPYPGVHEVTIVRTANPDGSRTIEHRKYLYLYDASESQEYPQNRSTDYTLKDPDGNYWVTHSVNYDRFEPGTMVRWIKFDPWMLAAPAEVKPGLPWGGASRIEVCDNPGEPTGDLTDPESLVCADEPSKRFHLETRTMLGIEDIEVSAGSYTGCLKVREDRMSQVWGPDRVRIRFRCPEVGEVIEYRMQQSDAYLSMPDPEQPATFYIKPQTEGRLYELNAINPD